MKALLIVGSVFLLPIGSIFRWFLTRCRLLRAHDTPSIDRTTHIVEECEVYKGERDVLEEMRKVDECDAEKFSTLDNSEKSIAILGDRCWPQKARQERDAK